MPVYAYLENDDIPCPECGNSLRIEAQPWTQYVKFWWGSCPSRVPIEPYQLGDAIRWRPSKDGTVHGWMSFNGYGCNIGEPAIENITVTDIRGELCQLPHTCPFCETEIGGTAIEIRTGHIEKAWAFRPGEFELEAFYLPQPNGSLLQMLGWDNRESEHIEA